MYHGSYSIRWRDIILAISLSGKMYFITLILFPPADINKCSNIIACSALFYDYTHFL